MRRDGSGGHPAPWFGHNTAARPLYEKLGYVPTNINMLKRLA